MNADAANASHRHSKPKKILNLLFSGLLIGLLTACGGGGGTPATTTLPDSGNVVVKDIREQLASLAGVSNVVEQTSSIAGTRFFVFNLSQPVDHQAPTGARFEQKITLLYRSASAPTVLFTSGYAIGDKSSQAELTELLRANQLSMEHRYFRGSTPQNKDWSKLDIWQSANDQHRLTLSLKPLLSAKWVSSGASKGGMTAIFHRRFFPDDVAATVAYVAPISFAESDSRYPLFEKQLGGSAQRLAIEQWQQAALNKREELLSLFAADAKARGASLTYLGLDKTLEFAILEAPFTLWQYGDANLAATVPPANASAEQLYRFLDAASFGVVTTWSDATMDYYQAYYYQTATQLGYPLVAYDYLQGLKYPDQDKGNAYPPYGVGARYDGGQAMRDIQNWVDQSASRMLLIYGENDPWTAGAFALTSSAQSRDNYKFIVSKGNHSAAIRQLELDQRQFIYDKLASWLSVSVAPASAPAAALVTGRKPPPGLE